jgi:hypothetical protein
MLRQQTQSGEASAILSPRHFHGNEFTGNFFPERAIIHPSKDPFQLVHVRPVFTGVTSSPRGCKRFCSLTTFSASCFSSPRAMTIGVGHDSIRVDISPIAIDIDLGKLILIPTLDNNLQLLTTPIEYARSTSRHDNSRVQFHHLASNFKRDGAQIEGWLEALSCLTENRRQLQSRDRLGSNYNQLRSLGFAFDALSQQI